MLPGFRADPTGIVSIAANARGVFVLGCVDLGAAQKDSPARSTVVLSSFDTGGEARWSSRIVDEDANGTCDDSRAARITVDDEGDGWAVLSTSVADGAPSGGRVMRVGPDGKTRWRVPIAITLSDSLRAASVRRRNAMLVAARIPWHACSSDRQGHEVCSELQLLNDAGKSEFKRRYADMTIEAIASNDPSTIYVAGRLEARAGQPDHAFLMKLGANGEPVWTIQLDERLPERIDGLEIAEDGDVWVLGHAFFGMTEQSDGTFPIGVRILGGWLKRIDSSGKIRSSVDLGFSDYGRLVLDRCSAPIVSSNGDSRAIAAAQGPFERDPLLEPLARFGVHGERPIIEAPPGR